MGQNKTVSAALWTNIPLSYKRFEMGIGARVTRSKFDNNIFVTAPSELTRGSAGIMSVFDSRIPANMDTVNAYGTHSQTCVNLGFTARYFLKSLFLKTVKLYVEVNFDVAGLGFGPSLNGKYQNNGNLSNTSAKPVGFNLFKVSDNNLGSLNSEFLLKAKIVKRIVFFGGFTIMMNEIRTGTQVQQVNGVYNDRFRNRSSGLVFGAQWIFNNP